MISLTNHDSRARENSEVVIKLTQINIVNHHQALSSQRSLGPLGTLGTLGTPWDPANSTTARKPTRVVATYLGRGSKDQNFPETRSLSDKFQVRNIELLIFRWSPGFFLDGNFMEIGVGFMNLVSHLSFGHQHVLKQQPARRWGRDGSASYFAWKQAQ